MIAPVAQAFYGVMWLRFLFTDKRTVTPDRCGNIALIWQNICPDWAAREDFLRAPIGPKQTFHNHFCRFGRHAAGSRQRIAGH